MRVIAARSILASVMVVISGAFFAPASAAPSKTESNPSEGEQLHEAPERVSITFDQPLDPDSSIQVTNHCDDRVDEQPTEVDGTEMSVAVTGDWGGMYHVTYVAKGLGGLTGQTTGSFTFSVHAGDACAGSEGGHDHGSGDDDRHPGSGGGHEGSAGHGSGTDDPGTHGEEHTASAHEGAAHRSSTHASSHASTSMDHGDLASTSNAKGLGDHAGHSTAADDDRDATNHITSAPVNAPVRGPGSEAIVISLTLCALLGVLGGAVLRASAPN